jgi:hypothetical protein
MYRTGKSLLLNSLFLKGNKCGFGVGPTVNPCTKGLLIWGRPLQIKQPDDSILNILVIDSEGLGAIDAH